MTASELRDLSMNFRLAWLIHEHKIPLTEMENFTKEELKIILVLTDDNETIRTINRLLT